MLNLKFTKSGSECLIAYTRADGSATWDKTHNFFVDHDLTHLAVESIFGFNSAFFGLIEAGRTIQSFEEKSPNDHRHPQFPEQAYLTEIVVGHLDNLRRMPDPDEYPLKDEILRATEEASLNLPSGWEQKLAMCVKTAENLIAEWCELTTNQSLEKTFPLPDSRP